MELERQNPHWEDGYFYPYEKKRFPFTNIQKSFGSGLITALYGLRRVGKSVLMKQLINEVLRNGTKRTDILYFSFDEETADFWEVIREYERKTGKQVSASNSVFIDEVQKIKDWRGKLKLLYDTSSARIVVSGSNSSLLRKGIESLAGRINEFFVPELSFKEFLYFRDKTSLFDSILEEKLENEFHEFIKRPFPEIAIKKDLDAKAYVDTISKKVIYEDLPSVFPIDEPQLLFRLFSIVCKNPGMTVDYQNLASDLGRNRHTISAYFDYLRYGFLLRRVFNYSGNQLTSEKKLKKFYPSVACFAEAEIPRTIETVVAQTLKPRFFWNMKNRFEVDFVFHTPLFGWEVKYKDAISKEDTKGLAQFKKTWPNATTILVSKKKEKEFVPYYRLEQFLEQKDIKHEIRLEDLLL